MQTQRTFTVNGEKIKIVQRKLAANRGYHTFINGTKYFSNLWNAPETAEDRAFVQWVRDNH